MPFNITKAIDQNKFILDIAGAKQKALSENLVNINTPGYVRQDIKFEDYLGGMNKPMETDLSREMGAVSSPEEGGGKVNMMKELVAMQKNALFYTLATKRITKLAQDVKTVTQLGR